MKSVSIAFIEALIVVVLVTFAVSTLSILVSIFQKKIDSRTHPGVSVPVVGVAILSGSLVLLGLMFTIEKWIGDRRAAALCPAPGDERFSVTRLPMSSIQFWNEGCDGFGTSIPLCALMSDEISAGAMLLGKGYLAVEFVGTPRGSTPFRQPLGKVRTYSLSTRPDPDCHDIDIAWNDTKRIQTALERYGIPSHKCMRLEFKSNGGSQIRVRTQRLSHYPSMELLELRAIIEDLPSHQILADVRTIMHRRQVICGNELAFKKFLELIEPQ